jgi:hypothetical protein
LLANLLTHRDFSITLHADNLISANPVLVICMDLNHRRETAPIQEACPNLETCSLPGHPLVVGDNGLLDRYRHGYCLTAYTYLGCLRFRVFQELGFCPGFLLPDQHEEMETIMNRYDNGEE